jgi:hypothetical protein
LIHNLSLYGDAFTFNIPDSRILNVNAAQTPRLPGNPQARSLGQAALDVCAASVGAGHQRVRGACMREARAAGGAVVTKLCGDSPVLGEWHRIGDAVQSARIPTTWSNSPCMAPNMPFWGCACLCRDVRARQVRTRYGARAVASVCRASGVIASALVSVSSMSVNTSTSLARFCTGQLDKGSIVKTHRAAQVTRFSTNGLRYPADCNAKPACSRSGWK